MKIKPWIINIFSMVMTFGQTLSLDQNWSKTENSIELLFKLYTIASIAFFFFMGMQYILKRLFCHFIFSDVENISKEIEKINTNN